MDRVFRNNSFDLKVPIYCAAQISTDIYIYISIVPYWSELLC